MSTPNIWTGDRSMARGNTYATKCAQCRKEVAATTGNLIATATSEGTTMSNGSLHKDCALPMGWYYRAIYGEGVSLAEARGHVMPVQAEQAEPEAATPAREPTADELERAARKLLADNTAEFLALVPDLVRTTMHEATRTVEIKIPKLPTYKATTAHKILPDIIMAVAARTNPFIVGPAGSGKTTLCMQVADALKMKFYMSNSVAGKHELLGFRDATGKPVHTDFYKCYKTGGLFLFDEADNCNPNALVALNSAIANGICEFAGETVRAHKDFQVIASANTFGRGADQMYVGRNKLDAATLDRYQTYVMDYDEELERALAGNDDWCAYVQSVRKVIYSEKIAHVVSPRASIAGARLLAAGMDRSKVEEACVWKGLDNNHRVRITSRMGARA